MSKKKSEKELKALRPEIDYEACFQDLQLKYHKLEMENEELKCDLDSLTQTNLVLREQIASSQLRESSLKEDLEALTQANSMIQAQNKSMKDFIVELALARKLS